jgi:hypothetical protein
MTPTVKALKHLSDLYEIDMLQLRRKCSFAVWLSVVFWNEYHSITRRKSRLTPRAKARIGFQVHRQGVITEITTRGGMIKTGLRLLWLAVRWHKFYLHVTGFVSGRRKNVLQTPVDKSSHAWLDEIFRESENRIRD